MKEKLYTVEELADLLHTTKSNLYERVKNNEQEYLDNKFIVYKDFKKKYILYDKVNGKKEIYITKKKLYFTELFYKDYKYTPSFMDKFEQWERLEEIENKYGRNVKINIEIWKN